MSTPYIAVGNDELGGPLYKGELIPCPDDACYLNHDVRLSTSAGVETDMLMFVKCGGTIYLVGMNGRRMPKRKKTQSEEQK